jgi:hypothetical protein
VAAVFEMESSEIYPLVDDARLFVRGLHPAGSEDNRPQTDEAVFHQEAPIEHDDAVLHLLVEELALAGLNEPHTETSANFMTLRSSHSALRDSLDTIVSVSSCLSDRLSQNAIFGQSILQMQIPYQNMNTLSLLGSDAEARDAHTREGVPSSSSIQASNGEDGEGVSRIFCGHVPRQVSEKDVIDHFSEWGKVVDVYFPVHTRTMKRYPCCFVTFEDESSVKLALSKSPIDIGGITIKTMTLVRCKDSFTQNDEMSIKTRETFVQALEASPEISGSISKDQIDNIAALLAMNGASTEAMIAALSAIPVSVPSQSAENDPASEQDVEPPVLDSHDTIDSLHSLSTLTNHNTIHNALEIALSREMPW